MRASFFNTPLLSLPHIGGKYAGRLERLGLHTIHDLLNHFPSRYEDFSRLSSITDLVAGEQATVRGVVETMDIRKSFRRRMIIVQGFIRDDTGLIKVIWFNQPYLKNTLVPGRVVNISGKVSEEGGEIYFSHPSYELIDRKTIEPQETRHTGRLVPVYPETNGLTSRTIRFLIQPLLGKVSQEEWIPRPILEKYRLPEINEAVRNVHFPQNIEEVTQARRRFTFENLFLLQLLNAQRKMELVSEQAPKITVSIPDLRETLKLLPFSLTVSQKKSLWEIIQDLETGKPMNRLLQGDVGSGKTVVAALTALSVVRAGYQTVLLAPTEVLATQHFETFKKLFRTVPREHQPVLGLLTGHQARIFYESDLEKEVKPPVIRESISSGKIDIVIGTHAVIEKAVRFKKIGLVIIDEQHRFGVAQRAALVKNSPSLPHFLSMSATPIPRTLTLTIFGDLDLSVITELPKGRKVIRTTIVPPEERAKAYALIRKEIESGRQAFVVCPRIEAPESEDSIWEKQKLEVKSVKEEYEKLAKHIFPDLRVAMLHGQMKAKEKNTISQELTSGKIHILVSTSVIEVGVDVPNATIMMIESAERFGLAQLYQFRGRVGRGEHQSYCLLFTESGSATTRERLKALLEAKNGFELAERDLKLRGPGQFLGTAQTGFPDGLMQGLTDMKLLTESKTAAESVFKKDPELKNYPPLHERLMKFRKYLHEE